MSLPPARQISRDSSIDGSSVIIAISFFLTILASIAVVDRPLAQFSHAHLRQTPFLWLTWIAAPVEPASMLWLGASGMAWLFGWRPGPIARLLVTAAVAALVADEFKTELKYVFGRPWPETWVEHNPSFIGTHTYGFFPDHGGAGWASFPSGHTTMISAPMAVFWRGLRRWRAWTLAPPILVAVGLVGMDFHFMSDCLAGAALGALVGRGIAELVGAVHIL
jgi:membrane-associated phospholipid phosphatase